MGEVIKEVLAAQNLLIHNLNGHEIYKNNNSNGVLEIVVVAALPPECFISQDVIKAFQSARNTWRVRLKGSLSETIRTGLEGLISDPMGIGFLPGDQAGVERCQLAQLMEEFLRVQPDFLVPVSGSSRGNPVFFHRRFVPELLVLQGEQGGKAIMEQYPERWVQFEVRPDFLLDIDTPEDYRKSSAKVNEAKPRNEAKK